MLLHYHLELKQSVKLCPFSFQETQQFHAKKTKIFTTNEDSQTIVLTSVYEGERSVTSSNNLLGEFELKGIPPAPRGVPQIEVTFEIDSNGIMHVTAQDKANSSTKNQITITNERGRLTQDDIDKMVKDAEKFKKEDEKNNEKSEARSDFENYAYSLKTASREVGSKLNVFDLKELDIALDDAFRFLDGPLKEKTEYEKKQRELENVANPIMSSLYEKNEPESKSKPKAKPKANTGGGNANKKTTTGNTNTTNKTTENKNTTTGKTSTGNTKKTTEKATEKKTETKTENTTEKKNRD